MGLTAALALATAGVRVQVLEAASSLVKDLRASTFHPPTLDMLDAFGIAADLLAQGLICPHWQVRLHEPGKLTAQFARFDLSVLADATAHPYRLQCEQFKLSAALLTRLQGLPQARVQFDTQVTAVGAEKLQELLPEVSIAQANGKRLLRPHEWREPPQP